VTGFTIGHSVTLTMGFFGLVPSGAWFVPTVEAGIAISIIYAAAIAVLPRATEANSERNLFIVTSAIGLLHGLGFSFVLHKILQIDSPNIWQSLLAFNVGVEIGQLLIIVLSWPLFRLVSHLSRPTWNSQPPEPSDLEYRPLGDRRGVQRGGRLLDGRARALDCRGPLGSPPLGGDSGRIWKFSLATAYFWSTPRKRIFGPGASLAVSARFS
jgi:hypothetical protein